MAHATDLTLQTLVMDDVRIWNRKSRFFPKSKKKTKSRFYARRSCAIKNTSDHDQITPIVCCMNSAYNQYQHYCQLLMPTIAPDTAVGRVGSREQQVGRRCLVRRGGMDAHTGLPLGPLNPIKSFFKHMVHNVPIYQKWSLKFLFPDNWQFFKFS